MLDPGSRIILFHDHGAILKCIFYVAAEDLKVFRQVAIFVDFGGIGLGSFFNGKDAGKNLVFDFN